MIGDLWARAVIGMILIAGLMGFKSLPWGAEVLIAIVIFVFLVICFCVVTFFSSVNQRYKNVRNNVLPD